MISDILFLTGVGIFAMLVLVALSFACYAGLRLGVLILGAIMETEKR